MSTYQPIGTVTLSSANSAITFSGISSSFTDLSLLIVGRQTSANTIPLLRFNSDSASNYSDIIFAATQDSNASINNQRSSNVTGIRFVGPVSIGTQPAVSQIDILSYSNTSVFKSPLCQFSYFNQGTLIRQGRVIGLWRNTVAINSITLTALTDTWVAGTTATLYGITRA